MKTKIHDSDKSLEWNAGREYAEFLASNGAEFFASNGVASGAVDIEKMLGGTCSIPDGDYVSLIDEGIENPDGREYWGGFNSFYNEVL